MPAAINPADNPLSREFYHILAHNFGPTVAPLLLALGVAVALWWPMRSLSFRLGAVAKPGGRNIHQRPTARLGGLALAAGFLDSAVVFALIRQGGENFPRVQLVGLIVVASITVVVMLIDDLRQLPARYKFGAQVLL